MLQHFLDAGRPHVYFPAAQTSLAENLRDLAEAVLAAVPESGLGPGDLPTFRSILEFVWQASRECRFALVLDDFQYMLAAEASLPSQVQAWWDMLKRHATRPTAGYDSHAGRLVNTSDRDHYTVVCKGRRDRSHDPAAPQPRRQAGQGRRDEKVSSSPRWKDKPLKQWPGALCLTLLCVLACSSTTSAAPPPPLPAACCSTAWPVPPAIMLGDERPWEVISPTYRRKVYQGDRLTMVLFEVQASTGATTSDTAIPLHSHEQDQVTYVMEGQAQVQVGTLRRLATAGSVYVVPSGVPHGIQVTSPRFVGLDVFSPVRADFSVGPNEVKAFVHRWFSWFDHQVDESVFLAHLAPTGLLMRFPEAELNSHDAFRAWYAGIRQAIASNSHDVQVTSVRRLPDGTFDVAMDVDWRAVTRDHQNLHMRVRQRWIVQADADGHLRVRRYVVEPVPAKGGT